MFIVILGGGIDLNGNLPNHVYQRLDKAVQLYFDGIQKENIFIITSGKYSFLYDQLKRYPPITEAEKMAQYLLIKGIPKDKLLLEKKSKDSIGNAYYLKKDFFIPLKVDKAIIITSHFHLERIKYIFNKVFGKNYQFEFIGLQEKLAPDEESKVVNRQNEVLIKTKEILELMPDGDHDYLTKKLYKIKYYLEKRPAWVINFVAKGR
ncbi:hypothetical protein CO166_00350 [Candidatus Roizmanbacteria bacterium CG_4_9_14_3_um_filter_36_11]|nr:MAG: hypothetical protein CO166_00350 [Candidatus Roizmanbacteria bacterium CG_4_9_14_3_um_filter_36_11]